MSNTLQAKLTLDIAELIANQAKAQQETRQWINELRNEGKRGAKVEERFYFKDGAIFKWLTTEKPAPVFHGEDYQATTEMHTANCAAFLAALKKAASKK